MPHYGPISHRDLVAALRAYGCVEVKQQGRSHPHMVCNGRRVIIPNPHGGVIGVNRLADLLRRAGISREEWEQL